MMTHFGLFDFGRNGPVQGQSLDRRAMSRAFFLFAWVLCLASGSMVRAAEWGTLSAMHNYAEVFGLAPDHVAKSYRVTVLEANAAGNIFHPGEQPRFTFQIENRTDRPLRAKGRVAIIRYSQSSRPGDNWIPELHVLETFAPLPLDVDLKPNGWANLRIEPKIPETKGGYGLVIDLGPLGRQYLTSCVRTFKPQPQRIQFPKQSLEEMPAHSRAAWNTGHPLGHRVPSHWFPRFAQEWAQIIQELHSLHANMVTVERKSPARRSNRWDAAARTSTSTAS